MIAELERSIARYKEEYAVLISEAQAIKADLAAVEAKVNLILFHGGRVLLVSIRCMCLLGQKTEQLKEDRRISNLI